MKTDRNIAIVIPARYASTRFPGKPLAVINGKPMLDHVVHIAKHAAHLYSENISVMVATEDQRIADHCETIDVDCIITSDQCATGSDRILDALDRKNMSPDFVIGLQGDAPGTPAEAITMMIEKYVEAKTNFDVLTPVMPLSWDSLDALRQSKTVTPFTGTTAIIDKNGQALWFSKNIIPAIRKEEHLRTDTKTSPVYQHLGLYGYKLGALKRFVSLPQSHYEILEGLEQLRLLENGLVIQTYTLDIENHVAQAGIDSPEDVARFEALTASQRV